MRVVLALALYVVCSLLSGLAIKIGWNLSMPQLFSMPEATWTNGIGLALLIVALKPFPSAEMK